MQTLIIFALLCVDIILIRKALSEKDEYNVLDALNALNESTKEGRRKRGRIDSKIESSGECYENDPPSKGTRDRYCINDQYNELTNNYDAQGNNELSTNSSTTLNKIIVQVEVHNMPSDKKTHDNLCIQ